MSEQTRTRLLEGALRSLGREGIAAISARSIAAAAGVNQALVFYHFGSVEGLLVAACHHGARQRVARYRDGFAEVTMLSGLLELGRRLHAQEREQGHVAVLAQLLAGARTHPRLAAAIAAGLQMWVGEIEGVLERVLAGSAVEGIVDVHGLARAVAASFMGLELYEGVDEQGAQRALDALARLAALAVVLEELGLLAQRALRVRLRRAAEGRG
ncbi:TetR family transcriptional regulator [Marinactinospora endophytica]